MFPEQLSFRFSIVTFAILFACSSTASGGFFDDFANKVNDGFNSIANAARSSACVANHMGDYNKCYDTVKSAYSNFQVKSDDGSDIQEHCCNFLAYRDCVESISYAHCGQEAAQAVDMVLGPMKDTVFQCKDYKTVFDCMDPMIRIGVIVIIIVVALALIGCLVKICQSCFC